MKKKIAVKLIQLYLFFIDGRGFRQAWGRVHHVMKYDKGSERLGGKDQ